MSAYDAAAPSFDRHRALPIGVPEKIRAAILASLPSSCPRLLDLGAGTGRTGWCFAGAGDDYVGVDLSLGMLREFARRANDGNSRRPRLVHADGALLPFADATFDAVMLMQIFGGLPHWRKLCLEAKRVVRSRGALIVGRTAAPRDGVDAQLKRQLASVLATMGVRQGAANAGDEVQQWLARTAQTSISVTAAEWDAERTARGFLDRHPTGARFALLPAAVKDEAMRKLAARAIATFGSLDTVFSERYAFEIRVFGFQ